MRKLRRWDWLWPACAATVCILYHLLKGSRAAMNAAAGFFAPVKRVLAAICSLVPVSVAEVLLLLAALLALLWLVLLLRRIFRAKARALPALRGALHAAAAGLTVYALLCLLLGANYYADDFKTRAGIATQPVPAEELAEVTAYFAHMTSAAAEQVSRDEGGLYAEDLSRVIAGSTQIYAEAETLWPFLAYPDPLPPKALLSSELFSRANYTGIYFPFTGEANINVHSPGCMIPATIAHELAHQRGVAAEDEANFVAVVASTTSADPAYIYSGYLLGYIHLSNALYLHSPERYFAVYELLSDEVRLDLAHNSAYWAQYETRLARISDEVYDGFLKEYGGQELGVESYGAVVDLLIAYYGGRI